MIDKHVDIPGDWNFEKINELGIFVIENFGCDFKLFIDYKSYTDLQLDFAAVRRYNVSEVFNQNDLIFL